MAQPVLSLFFMFCQIISLQSVTLCAEAVPSSTVASLWPSFLQCLCCSQSYHFFAAFNRGNLNSVFFLSRDVSTKTVFQEQLSLTHWLHCPICHISSSEACFREPTPLGIGYCFGSISFFSCWMKISLPHLSALCSWRLRVGACMVITQGNVDWIT